MALDDNGFTYVRSLPGIFKIVMIVSVFLHLFRIEYNVHTYVRTCNTCYISQICSLCAFICSIVLGLSWQIEAMAFFNIMQLIILIYGIAVLVIRLTNMLNVNWWKLDTIMSVMLGCLEFAATTLWATVVPAKIASLTAMVVSIYITHISDISDNHIIFIQLFSSRYLVTSQESCA